MSKGIMFITPKHISIPAGTVVVGFIEGHERPLSMALGEDVVVRVGAEGDISVTNIQYDDQYGDRKVCKCGCTYANHFRYGQSQDCRCGCKEFVLDENAPEAPPEKEDAYTQVSYTYTAVDPEPIIRSKPFGEPIIRNKPFGKPLAKDMVFANEIEPSGNPIDEQIPVIAPKAPKFVDAEDQLLGQYKQSTSRRRGRPKKLI